MRDRIDIEEFAAALAWVLAGRHRGMLKRPIETLGEGRTGYSESTLREIEQALFQQIEAVDERIAAVSGELKEAQAVRSELASDLDYLRRRIAAESKETLLQERMTARKRRKDGE